MGRLWISLATYADDQGTAYSDFVDISDRVIGRSAAKLKAQLDSNEFDIGIFRHSNFRLDLINTDGRFSDVGTGGTIFKFTRNNSKVRLEWEINSEPISLGFWPVGKYPCSPRQLIGDFLLNDDTMKSKVGTQRVSFACLGYTTLFDREKVPYSDISDGQSLSTIMHTCLNQESITDYLTVAAANISVDQDNNIDDKTLGDLENKTVNEALKKMLLYSNSVLYVDDNTVYIQPRSASADLEFTFYGPGSLEGTENIIDIVDYRSGTNRIINLCTIKDQTNSAGDSSSQAKYGTRKKEIEFLPVTTSGSRDNAVQAIIDEFKNPLIEFKISTQMNYDRLDLKLLDKIKVVYDGRVIPADNTLTWDAGEDYDAGYNWAEEIIDIRIDANKRFKVMSISYDFDREVIDYNLREVA